VKIGKNIPITSDVLDQIDTARWIFLMLNYGALKLSILKGCF
jgi:hypothetical protein